MSDQPQNTGVEVPVAAAPQSDQQSSQTTPQQPAPGAAPQEGQQQPQAPVAPQPPPDVPEEFRSIAKVGDNGSVMVPLDAVKDERRKRQEFEGKLRQREQEMFLLRNFQQQPQQPQQQPAAPEFKLPDAVNSLDDKEVVLGSEVKNIFGQFAEAVNQQLTAARQPQQNDRQQEMIGETMIQSMDPQGEARLAAGIQAIRSNPMLGQQMQYVNPMLRPFIAYRMGYGESFQQAAQNASMQTGHPMAPQAPQVPQYPGYPQQPGQPMQPGQFQQQQPAQPNPQVQQIANQPPDFQQIAQNQQIPPATSSVTGTAPVNQAQYWATAPKDEFERKLRAIKTGQA